MKARLMQRESALDLLKFNAFRETGLHEMILHGQVPFSPPDINSTQNFLFLSGGVSTAIGQNILPKPYQFHQL